MVPGLPKKEAQAGAEPRPSRGQEYTCTKEIFAHSQLPLRSALLSAHSNWRKSEKKYTQTDDGWDGMDWIGRLCDPEGKSSPSPSFSFSEARNCLHIFLKHQVGAQSRIVWLLGMRFVFLRKLPSSSWDSELKWNDDHGPHNLGSLITFLFLVSPAFSVIFTLKYFSTLGLGAKNATDHGEKEVRMLPFSACFFLVFFVYI